MELKKDCNLRSQLYVFCQVHGGDLDTFFSQKLKPFLHQSHSLENCDPGSKSDLLMCFEQHCNAYEKEQNVDAIALNGAAILNTRKLGQFKAFKHYATNVFLPCVRNRLQKLQHTDVSWDSYFNVSLKAQT